MIDLARGVLEEFAERSHPATRVRDGRFVARSRSVWPDVVGSMFAPQHFEVHRKIAARIAGRRVAARRTLWIPT